MRVRLTIALSGTIEQDITKEQWDELRERLESDGQVRLGDGIEVADWSDAINQLDGEIEDAEIASNEGA